MITPNRNNRVRLHLVDRALSPEALLGLRGEERRPDGLKTDGMSRRPWAVSRVALLGAAVAAGGLVVALLLASLPDRSRAEGVLQQAGTTIEATDITIGTHASYLPFLSQQAGTIIEATTLVTDTVWTAAGNPYEVRGIVWIPPSVSLTIEKGVRLSLKGEDAPAIVNDFRGGIMGEGNLVIRGTPDERVFIEGPPPLAGHFPPLGWAVAGSQTVEYADLRNISVRGCLPASPLTPILPCQGEPLDSFEHVNFLESHLDIKAARVRIADSKVSRGYGIQVVTRPAEIVGNLIWLGWTPQEAGPLSTWSALAINSGTLMSNSIIYNGGGGVYADSASGTSITVTANNIYGNKGWDFAAMAQIGRGPPKAPNNWWGTTDIPTIQSHITRTGGFPPALDFLPIATAPIPGVPTPYAAYLPLVLNGAAGW